MKMMKMMMMMSVMGCRVCMLGVGALEILDGYERRIYPVFLCFSIGLSVLRRIHQLYYLWHKV